MILQWLLLTMLHKIITKLNKKRNLMSIATQLNSKSINLIIEILDCSSLYYLTKLWHNSEEFKYKNYTLINSL